jgi:hypothetical protein
MNDPMDLLSMTGQSSGWVRSYGKLAYDLYGIFTALMDDICVLVFFLGILSFI